MKKGNIILLVLSSIYTLVIEYMFYPEYIRYQEAGGLFLMTNDYLQGYLLAPTGWNSLITNFLSQFYHSLSLGLFVETGLLLITAVILLLYLRQRKAALHGWIITVPIIMYLSISLVLIRTFTIQSIPFDTRFLSFHPEQSNTLYQRFDRYSFLISSFTGKLLTFIVSVWNCFRTNFLQTKRLPYVTGYKSGTCCRMASVMAKLCFLHPGQSAVHIH